MSYLVFVTFDLKGAKSSDYEIAYKELSTIGLEKVHAGTSREVVIPTTSAMGKFSGSSAIAVRDHVRNEVAKAFKNKMLKSEIFVVVGENGTWASTTT